MTFANSIKNSAAQTPTVFCLQVKARPPRMPKPRAESVPRLVRKYNPNAQTAKNSENSSQ